ncbi:MAG: AAA family ATPase [Lachnospiraceae bacterium]|nr:AAA family ATPase [Lachnospiraceae bacterium]
MNYYELHVKFDRAENAESDDGLEMFPGDSDVSEKRFYKNLCTDINERLDMDSERKTAVYAYYAAEGLVKFIYEADMGEIKSGKVRKEIQEFFRSNPGICGLRFSKPKELTAGGYQKIGRMASRNDYIDSFDDDDFGAFTCRFNNFAIRELLMPERTYGKRAIKKLADEELADSTLYEELERIYSDDNSKKFYGNPVHYLLNVSSRDSIESVATVLGKALRSNKRLLGRRITVISEMEQGCHDDDDFENVIARSDGNMVVFDLSATEGEDGSYTNSFHRVIEYLMTLYGKYGLNTLFVFVKNMEHPGFADILMEKTVRKARIIEIKEGGGDRERTKDYIRRLAKEHDQPVDEEELKDLVSEKSFYKVGEARAIYNRYFGNALMYSIYKAYKACPCLTADNKKPSDGPYKELQDMVGLTEIKKVVDNIINNAKIQKLRNEQGLDVHKASLHMVFTGNPGSAKTTVARLLAQILAKEGIIENGEVVECGRADLIGKFVGWTAPNVRAKFRQAEGGILFIDEAYSLTDDSHSFGDEAINAIVQEMENRRDNVMVIFAGYPDKMKEFLDRNEGLRSRVAFHLDFPDYDADELVDILKLMAEQKKLTLADGCIEKCRGIFEGAVEHKDYGNGRFVRNLLEQAIMAQSGRLAKQSQGKKISRKALNSLVPEDFDVNASRKYADKKQTIGFSA